MQEKVSIMDARGRQKSPSLAITVWHHSASLVMPDSDTRDGFFYKPLITMIASSLPHVAEMAEGHMRLREQVLWYSTRLLPSNQTGNKYFVCSLSGSQLMWQIYLYLPGPTGKIRYQNPDQNFNGKAWV